MDKFSALSEPTRRKIVELLAKQGPLPASEIAAQFRVSAPAISQHLKVLREADVLRVEKRAQQRIYALNPQAMSELGNWAELMRRLWDERFDALEELIRQEMEAEENKPVKGKRE